MSLVCTEVVLGWCDEVESFLLLFNFCMLRVGYDILISGLVCLENCSRWVNWKWLSIFKRERTCLCGCSEFFEILRW